MADQNFRVKRGLEVGVGGTVITTTSNGSVGLGTTNPLQRLQIGTANTLGINTTGTVFVITSNADVGIGTTNPTTKLDVRGNVNISGVVTATTFVGTLSGFASTSGVSTSVIGGIASVTQLSVTGVSTFSSNIIQTSGSVGLGTTNPLQRLQIGTANTLGINTTGTVFVVTSNADVGIGTTNPISKLHVIGDVRVTGVITANSFVKSGGTSSQFLKADGSVDSSTYLTTESDTLNTVTTRGNSTSNGISVGVLTATSGNFSGIITSSGLNVSGVSTFSSNIIQTSGSVGLGTTNPLQRLQIGTANTLGINTTGTVFVVTSNADVGIGTTNPTAKLHVVGDTYVSGVVTATTFVGTLTGTATTATNVIGGIASVTQLSVSGVSTFSSNIIQTSGSVGLGTTNPLQTLQVGTANTLGINTTGTVFVVTSNADVGIGTTNPRSKLDVRGAITVGGAVSITAERDSGNNDVIYFNPLNESRVSIGINTTLNWSSVSGTPDVAFVADKTILGYPKIAIANPTSGPFYQLRATYSNVSAPYGYVRQDIYNGSYAIALDDTSNAFSVGDRTSLDTDRTSNFSSGNEAFVVLMNGSTSLFHSKSKKLETSGVGVTVTGTTSTDQLIVSGISTFTNGPVLIGSGTSTGTASQRLQVTGGAYVSGFVGVGTTNPQYIFTVTDTGTPATTGLTNCLADFTTTANSYGQINLRNTSTGTNASSDIIVTADNGSDTTNFIDLGINNSGFSVGSWTINGANDGYLYTSDGNLSIGAINASVPKYISFFTGGTLISNERMRVNATGVGIGTTNPTSTLTVQGTTRITGITSIRDVTIDKSIASPNATVPVAIIGVTTSGISTETNIDVVLLAKGTGATLAHVPDGTAVGGNKRGQYATDLQKDRSSSSNVASGNHSVICGGQKNVASASMSSVLGGGYNNATGTYSVVLGGWFSDASGDGSVTGGWDNTASGSYSACFGYQNISSGTYSAVGGGQYNNATAAYSTIPGGRYGTTRSIIGNIVFPACNIPIASSNGATQSALLLLARETTDASPTVLTSDASAASTTNQVILPNNSAYFFKGSCIAGVTGAGNTKAWEFKGAIKRGANAASTSIVGSVIKDVIASDAGASTWDITITADTTNGGIAVTVTGAASTTIRWVCKIETTEMTY